MVIASSRDDRNHVNGRRMWTRLLCSCIRADPVTSEAPLEEEEEARFLPQLPHHAPGSAGIARARRAHTPARGHGPHPASRSHSAYGRSAYRKFVCPPTVSPSALSTPRRVKALFCSLRNPQLLAPQHGVHKYGSNGWIRSFIY